jgi:ParB family transcriptional regulator, chromosome partitioning protein
VAEERAERNRAQRLNLPLSRIKPRAEDTRPLRDRHVADLVESIGTLGLIEPLVVDLKSVLLAGGHRLAAIHVLKATDPKLYDQTFPEDLVPVRVMPFDAETEPERALQVELAENEKRVNYSRDQIERLAVRLRSLNYRETRGRPKQGEKALGPALAVAIGVSTRYVRWILSGQDKDHQKNRNRVPILSRAKTLRKIEAALEELISLPEPAELTKADQALLKAVPTFLVKLKASLDEKSKQQS